ncbi:hypothetical protein [Marivirga sp.]|uniref:hypothetical protein n=1 Tax=Marivirga sp. TaxID=2018662 RepID=UPI003DA6F659
MEPLHKLSLLTIIGLVLFFSCEKNEELMDSQLCDNNFIYSATADSKIYLKQSSSEIFIEFEQDSVTDDLAELILSKYSFIDVNIEANNYNKICVRINESVAECTVVNDYLKILNEDDEIFSATPVFYLSENDPDSYYILISEVLTKNNENLITESDFIEYAENLNLELIEAKYSTQHFKVKDVKTGFEALELANKIFESGMVKYSHPNSIMKIEHF